MTTAPVADTSVPNQRQPRVTEPKKKPKDNRFALDQAKREITKAETELERAKENYAPNSQFIKDAQKKVDEAKGKLKDLQTGKPSERREKQEDFLQDYYDKLGPWVSQLMQEDRELRRLLRDAVANNWDAAEFDKQLRRTEWWKDPKKTESWLEAFKKEFGDGPRGQWTKDLKKTGDTVRSRAKSVFGIDLDDEVVERIARRAIYQGWDNDDLDTWIASRVRGDMRREDFSVGGNLETTKEALRRRARDYGLTMNENQLQREALRILDPSKNYELEDSINDFVNQARSRWVVFGDRISSDYTVRDASRGYINTMAELLEIDSDQIELSDELLGKALSGQMDENNDPKLMSLWDFQKAVREDSRWQSTENAQTTYTNFGERMLKMFGFRG